MISIQRKTIIHGKRKVGFDASVLAAVIDKPVFNQKKLEHMFNQKDIFFISEWAYNDTLKALKKFSKKEYLKQKLDKFIKKRNITIINKILPPQSNPSLKKLYELCKKNKIDSHQPDSFIVADYHFNGINKIYTSDKEMIKSARVMGIDCEDFNKMLKWDKSLKNRINQALHKFP